VQAGTERRLVDAVLVFLAVLALLVGVGYWLAAAPGSNRIEPVGEPAVSAPQAPSLEDAVETGLSVMQGSVLYERAVLAAGEHESWKVWLDEDVLYMIDVLCVGGGAALVELPDGGTSDVPCDGSIMTFGLHVAPGAADIAVRRVDGGEVAIGVRVTEG
jgi:hypothetical protein